MFEFLFSFKYIITIFIVCIDLASTKKLVKVTWMAPFFSGGGYCSEATYYALSLKSSNISLKIGQHGDSYNYQYVASMKEEISDYITKLEKTRNDPKETIMVCHSEPGAWIPAQYETSPCPVPKSKYKIGRTMFETDRLPNGWVKKLNKMDEIWIPTQFHYDIFKKYGVEENKLKIIPEGIDTDQYNPDIVKPINLFDNNKDYKFFSVFKWEMRKGWDVLLKAYFNTFNKKDNVILYILTNAYHSTSDFKNEISNWIDINKYKKKHLPKYKILSELSDDELLSYYKTVNCLIQPSRGEGWGRPHVEAMSMSLPVIATNWSGNTAYMNENNSLLIDCMYLAKINEGPWKDHRWCEPNVTTLGLKMKYLYDNPEEGVLIGKKAREDMIEYYSLPVIGKILEKEFLRIDKTLNSKFYDEL